MSKDKGYIQLIILVLVGLAAITYYQIDVAEPVRVIKQYFFDLVGWFGVAWRQYIDPAIQSIIGAFKSV